MVVFLDVKKLFTVKNVLVIAVVLVLIALAIYFRSDMLQYYGFFEPDGFYYFSVMRATVNAGFSIPQYLSTSGWPSPALVAEAHGIYWVTLLPYAILQFFGVSYYTIMRLMPMAFALLDMLGAYLLSRYISKDKVFGLLVIAFVALSMANAARTSALIYRGDTFVTFFLIMALVFFAEIFTQENRRKQIISAAAAGIFLALSNLVWTGAGFADLTFLISFIFITIFAFAWRKDKLLSDGMYVIGALAVWIVIVALAQAVGFIGTEQFAGLQALWIYIAGSLLWVALYLISREVLDVMRVPMLRAVVVLVIILGPALVFFLADPNYISSVLANNGFGASGGIIASTTQELQKPTYLFLSTSFGVNLFTSLPMLAFTATNAYVPNVWYSYGGILGVLLIMICFIPFFFMQVYDSDGLLGGNPKLRFDINIGVIALMSFFLVTVYLQSQAIRFNSILSVPVAIASAYTIYWFVAAANKLQKKNLRFISLAATLCILAVVVAFLIYYANLYSSTLVQADSINPFFISAMQWLGANSPSNSVVLTLWPDGSVVEAVANRTTVMDSVGAENGSKATPFAAWLLNSSPDPQFLTGPLMGSPNYLVVRNSWLIETQGIYTEANITTDPNEFLYEEPVALSEQVVNSTSKYLVFRLITNSTFPVVIVSVATSNTTAGAGSNLLAYAQSSATQTSAFANLVLSNTYTGSVVVLNQSQSFNSTNGETFVVEYSSPSGAVQNVTGAYVLAPGLADSNMGKALFMCGINYCIWDNSHATMKQVFSNLDTKIFSITYNDT